MAEKHAEIGMEIAEEARKKRKKKPFDTAGDLRQSGRAQGNAGLSKMVKKVREKYGLTAGGQAEALEK
jgi:hypothetical protein